MATIAEYLMLMSMIKTPEVTKEYYPEVYEKWENKWYKISRRETTCGSSYSAPAPLGRSSQKCGMDTVGPSFIELQDSLSTQTRLHWRRLKGKESVSNH